MSMHMNELWLCKFKVVLHFYKFCKCTLAQIYISSTLIASRFLNDSPHSWANCTLLIIELL